MTAISVTEQPAFFKVIAAHGRSPEIPEESDVYGWLVGSWALQVLHYARVDVSEQSLQGEVHFGWVFEGRAIQDVWIMPARPGRSPNLPQTNNMFGTTLRVWDAVLQAWRITWINPVTGMRHDQIGRRVGHDIVQVGARADGTPTRWMFTEITPNSFRWTGEALQPDGHTWTLEGEFRATRIIVATQA